MGESLQAKDLPEGFYVILTDDTSENYENVTVEDNSADGLMDVTYSYELDFNETDYYQEIMYFIKTEFNEKQPYIEASIITPEGREIQTASGGISELYRFKFSHDDKLERRAGRVNPVIGLFSTEASVEAKEPEILKGTYIIKQG